MPLTIPIDASTVQALAQAIAQLTPADATATIEELKHRRGFGGIDWARAVANAIAAPVNGLQPVTARLPANNLPGAQQFDGGAWNIGEPGILLLCRDIGGNTLRTLEVSPNGAVKIAAQGAPGNNALTEVLCDMAGRLKVVARSADWSVVHQPGGAVLASASKAAAAGIRHVARSLIASLLTSVATANLLTVSLRDGVSGGGAILYTAQLAVPATPSAVDRVAIDLGAGIVGTAGNAMTWEFSGAGAANSFEIVSMVGYDLNAND